ncbi:hypothetical protein Tco_0465452 [Tanacetum coccineum]
MLNRHKNWLVHKQTACGKDFSNPFMVDNLPKIVGLSTHLASVVKSWLVHDQTVHALASPKANGIWLQRSMHSGTHNNQLRNSSNPRQQATINDGRVTLQLIQERQTSFAAGTTRTYTPRASGSNSRKQRMLFVTTATRRLHVPKQWHEAKSKRYDSCIKDKWVIGTRLSNDQILHEEKLAFLADPGILEVSLMANLSLYCSNALAEVHIHDNVNNNTINQAVQAMPSFEQSNVMNHLETKITSDSNIIPYS